MKKGKALKEPVGVTVVSPSYRALGREAVRRFRKYTGLKVVTLRCRDEDGFARKLELDLVPELRGRRVVFFDADWWLMRPWPELQGMAESGHWMGVQDPMVWHGAPEAFPGRDCEALGLDKHQYLNTGFLILDLGNAQHRRVVRGARRSMQKGVPGMMDTTDQGHWNLSMKREGVMPMVLPFVFNCFLRAVEWGAYPFIPRAVIGLHGAGIPTKDKLREMQCQAAVLGVEYQEMQPASVAVHHARNYELR